MTPTQHHVPEAFERTVDGREVACDDRLPSLRVGLLDERLDLGDGLLGRQDAGELEEARLHDGVDPAAHPGLVRDGEGIDHPEVDVLLDELALDSAGQVVPDLVRTVWRVEQERRSVPGRLQHLGPAQHPELVTGDEVGLLHEIGRADGLRPEPQVRHRDRSRLLGVVHEVALGEQVRALADDLDRCLVGADRPVRPEPEEDGLDLAGRALVSEVAVDRQAEVRDIVVDPDREVSLRPGRRELLEDGLDHRRGHLLGRQPVTSPDDLRGRVERRVLAVHRLGERRDDLEIERLANRARFLRSIEDRNGSNGARQRGDDLLRRERLEQADAKHPDLLSRRDQRVDRLLDGTAGRTHYHDHSVRVGRAVVVDQVVPASRPGRELVHDVLDDPGDREVVRIGRLACLEEDVGVLGGAPHDGCFRCQSAGSEGKDIVVADQGPDVVLVEDGDLVDLVRRAEAVEEMEEWDPGTQRGGVRDQREIVRFLDRPGGEHRPAGRARVHDVAVVAEDREGMGRDRPCRDVDDRRRQLAGDLEHVGDHEQQALRRREGRGQRALLERPVESPGGARFGLHLDDVGDLAPQVGAACCRPVVAVLGHRRGGCDRIDRDHLADGIGDASRGLIPVQALELLVHVQASHSGFGSVARPFSGTVQSPPTSADHDYPAERVVSRPCRAVLVLIT